MLSRSLLCRAVCFITLKPESSSLCSSPAQHIPGAVLTALTSPGTLPAAGAGPAGSGTAATPAPGSGLQPRGSGAGPEAAEQLATARAVTRALAMAPVVDK